MLLLFISFLAGVLTVLAPCVLPVLPVIIGGAVQGERKRNPYLITGALGVAIVIFTLVLKFSTAFINVPASVWSWISATILIAFGFVTLFPDAWDAINVKLGLSNRSDALLADSRKQSSAWGDVLIGLSLGPVFSSCSPTYFLILATVLPRSFATGLADLIAYALGLSLILLFVSLLGQRLIQKAKWAANPRGSFKRVLGVLFILVGVLIATGTDKFFQTWWLANSHFNITNVEQSLLSNAHVVQNQLTVGGGASSTTASTPADDTFPQYREIANPSGFVNATSVTIGQFVGKKVVLIDFMTYSCINCIRTFPFLNAWYDKYHDAGLEIIAIHTPEFAFEKNLDNVRAAMQRFGIKFPVVLDNDYGTWNAYGNQYWPRKYLIDVNGKVVYDHIGEGGYDETEAKIQELLRDPRLATTPSSALTSAAVHPANALTDILANSPETYFGSARNEYLANGQAGAAGIFTFNEPSMVSMNNLYLVGKWNMQSEFATTDAPNTKVLYRYSAAHVYFVASAAPTARIKVLRDGKPLTPQTAGDDISFENGQSYLTVKEERLYSIINEQTGPGEHTLELDVEAPGLNAYTFTFG